MVTRNCKLCGKEFDSTNGKLYCDGPHLAQCKICGKLFRFDGHRIPNCCSKECTAELRRRTSVEKYGTDIPSQSDEVKNKLIEANRRNEQKRRNTCIAKYGVENPSQSKDVRDKISRTVSSKECQDKIKQTNLKRYGVTHAMKRRDILLKNHKRKTSICSDGTMVDSNYERLVYDFCLRNKLEFETQVPIIYSYEGTEHITYIDFKIDDILFECKGGHILSGIYDSMGVPISKKLEVYRDNHVVVITDDFGRDIFGKPNSTESNGFKYPDKCKNPLIGVDVSLFDNPAFPYRDDRPSSFYDVRVSGQLSSREAFKDESIRWKMIKNRIEYSGGFIDNNQVLNALNVTRTCKQPSWFSKSFAKRLLKSYSTCDVVVDPFAGWGARYDASLELGKLYIGSDINEELVEWHKSKGRDISVCDAKNFRYDKPCTVFICPPYQDVELYVESQDVSMTQCQWLSMVMNNVPNAREYIMVCKVVDEGWDRFIIDEKVNRSHFGVNKEYVIVVPGSCRSEYSLSDVDINKLRERELEHKKYQSLRRKEARSNLEPKKWIHNSKTNEEKQVPVSCVDEYRDYGFKLGRIKTWKENYTWMYNPYTDDQRRVKDRDIDSHMNDGYILGRRPDEHAGEYRFIYRDDETKRVKSSELEYYIKDGWKTGFKSGCPNKGKVLIKNIETGDRTWYLPDEAEQLVSSGKFVYNISKSRGRVHIYNPGTNKEKMIPSEELDDYLKSGWIKGRKK